MPRVRLFFVIIVSFFEHQKKRIAAPVNNSADLSRRHVKFFGKPLKGDSIDKAPLQNCAVALGMYDFVNDGGNLAVEVFAHLLIGG